MNDPVVVLPFTENTAHPGGEKAERPRHAARRPRGDDAAHGTEAGEGANRQSACRDVRGAGVSAA